MSRRASADGRPISIMAAVVVAISVVGLLSLGSGAGALRASGNPTAAAAPAVAHTPEAALSQMLHALGSADVRAACRVAAPDGFPIRASDDLRECQRDLREQLEGLDERDLKEYRDVVVERAKVQGNSATIRPRDIADAPVAMRNVVFVLVEAGGRWYVVV